MLFELFEERKILELSGKLENTVSHSARAKRAVSHFVSKGISNLPYEVQCFSESGVDYSA